METQKEKNHEENNSGKKKKRKKQQVPSKEEEIEEQTPLKKKRKKLRKERESSHEEEEETSVKKKKNMKQQQKNKKKKQKENTTVVDEGMHAEEENGEHVERRAKTVNVSFRLLVPSKDIGKVIGKQGSRIQQLREEAGAHIKIGDAIMNLEERVIWIASKDDTLTSQSAAERALLLVATLLIRPENEDQDFAKIRLLVSGSQAKIIVGEDGITLDNIREDTGAIVNLFSKDRFPLLAFASATDKLLQLEGKVSQVQEALELVMARLRESPQQSRRSRGATKGGAFETTVQIKIPNNLIGKLIGKDGSTILQIKDQCRVSIEVDNDMKEGAQKRIVRLKGVLSQVTMAQTLLQVVLASKPKAE